MRDTVSFHIIQDRWDNVFEPDQYEVDPGGKFVFLQRLAHKILRRFGRAKMSTVKTSEIVLKKADIASAIQGQYFNMLKQGMAPRTIFIGRKWFDVLVERESRSMYIDGLFRFGNEPGERFTMLGCNLVVTPYIDDFFVAEWGNVHEGS